MVMLIFEENLFSPILYQKDMFCLINLIRYFPWLINIDIYYNAADQPTTNNR